MQVIENATLLKARLLNVVDDPDRPGMLQLKLQIEEAQAGANLPSLLQAGVGDTLAATVHPSDRGVVENLRPGSELALTVSLRAPGVHTVVPGSMVPG